MKYLVLFEKRWIIHSGEIMDDKGLMAREGKFSSLFNF